MERTRAGHVGCQCERAGPPASLGSVVTRLAPSPYDWSNNRRHHVTSKAIVVLREEHSGNDSRYLRAHLTEKGDLSIEGHDLGPSVEKFWGGGLDEYEWDITVRAADFPRLIAALGGTGRDDVLSLLAARCSESERYASRGFLEQQGIPIEFWSGVGD